MYDFEQMWLAFKSTQRRRLLDLIVLISNSLQVNKEKL